MKNFKKALFTLTATALTLGVGLASAKDAVKKEAKIPVPAQEMTSSKSEAVLFKIHDIKPVMDSEGIVKSCEYTATFYNRTHVVIRQAKIDLLWQDNITKLFPLEQKEENTEVKDIKNAEAPVAPAEEGEKIQSSLNIPSLNPYKQVTLQGNVSTDKCFALFDNLTFQVSECNTLNTEESTNARVNRANDAKNQNVCSSLFTYVDSKNPEYYDEFKEISYEEEVSNAKAAETKETSMIEKAESEIVSNIEKVKEVLAKIK